MFARYLLNVGLQESTIMSDGRNISAEGALETVRNVVRAMFDKAAAVRASAVHESDSEPTLVVEIFTSLPFCDRVRVLADALCSLLRQEAVAVARVDRDGGGEIVWGDLRGPMAARWGEFAAEYFLLLDGTRAA